MPIPANVLAKFPPQVRERYDFTQANYTGALQRITGIVCREHGPFSQYSAQLRKDGAGCPTCGDKVRRAKQRVPQAEMIARVQEVHKGRYTYERAVYDGFQRKFVVTCPAHGDFEIRPLNHLKGQGCPSCGALKRGRRLDIAGSAQKTAASKLAQHALSFEEQARAVHGSAYDYSKVVYEGRKTRVTITCPDHGPFEQTPDKHLGREQGCPECSHHRSKGEAAIVDFISIFATPIVRDRAFIAPKELDIFVPERHLAVEYCGEYWHAARSVEDEQRSKNRHVEKYEACRVKGVRLLTIYESEWLARPKVIKRLIRNALGKGRGSLMSRLCAVERVGSDEAAVFFEAYHPQGAAGYGEHFGLRYRGKLVACMRFIFGANDRGLHRTPVWTLSRYATRLSVRGGATRLLTAFQREYDCPLVKSFSDNRFFDGGMYESLGFTLEETSGPDYKVWHIKTGLRPKTDWQRRNIPARMQELGVPCDFDPETDPRSEREMTYALGARRLFDCGKKRWTLAQGGG